MSYLETTKQFYADAAQSPQAGLCCTTSPVWQLPELVVPARMLEMNYGCGTTVHPRDLAGSPSVAYVGIGGGLELLQFAYFSRRPGAVVGIEPVAEMRAAARANLREAAARNRWFREEFVQILDGDALALPLADGAVQVVAQNCLFNIFQVADLAQALAEVARVLARRGRFLVSDPIAPCELPAALRADERLRAMCLSGALTFDDYVARIVAAGFGTVEVRARRPYRVLDPARYAVAQPILLESVELVAIKDPVPADGPCVFTGRTAIYCGGQTEFDDGAGHRLPREMPVAVCDKTAAALARARRPDLILTPPTWHYAGGGCC